MWLAGDPAQPAPPAARLGRRNYEWRHFNSQDILSMPDKWEYPWLATWDLAFQAVALARIDAEFAKQQLILLGREVSAPQWADPGIRMGVRRHEPAGAGDVLHFLDNTTLPLRIRSMVGLIPLFGMEIIEADLLERVPDFKKRMEWFLVNRPVLAQQTSAWDGPGKGQRHMLALVGGDRMVHLLKRALAPAEFLSDNGIRALSKYHEAEPYVIATGGMTHEVRYEPAESRTGLFGGNSNWRGPVWFPLNYLLIKALQKCHEYENDDFRVECPTRSGRFMTLHEIANELSLRLINLFLRNDEGQRPVFGDQERMQTDPNWHDYIPFHEYFNGDTGASLGASHQTDWMGLVAEPIQQQGERMRSRLPQANDIIASEDRPNSETKLRSAI